MASNRIRSPRINTAAVPLLMEGLTITPKKAVRNVTQPEFFA